MFPQTWLSLIYVGGVKIIACFWQYCVLIWVINWNVPRDIREAVAPLMEVGTGGWGCARGEGEGGRGVTDEALVRKAGGRASASSQGALGLSSAAWARKNGRLRRFPLLSPQLQDGEIRHRREPENRNTVQNLPAGRAGIHHRVSLQSLARCPSICSVRTEQASLK